MAGGAGGTVGVVSDSLRLTIVYEESDEEGWIVARVPGVPGAVSQGRTRAEARENVIDALREVLLYRLEAEQPPEESSEPLELIVASR